MREDRGKKPSPEELLRRVEAEESLAKRGRLKIFLGYASGVGKSVRMLDEGRRRKMRGEDVVAGAAQAGSSEEAARLLDGFEVIPPLSTGIDTAAILRRRPAICLIDGLAYTNPPGSPNRERWQDVEELLAAGISVITTINLQYVRERQSEVERIRGKRVFDSVPESFLRTADEIEVVDAPPEYCFDQMRTAGPSGMEPAALERQLSELREIALLLAAEVVDAQLDGYLKRHGIEQAHGEQERVLVCVTSRSTAAELMIETGRRQADRFRGELFVICFERDSLPEDERRALDRHLNLARSVNARVEELHGEDFTESVLRFCETHGITQIFVGHSGRTGWWRTLFANPVEKLIARSNGIDIRIFPSGSPSRLD